MRRSFLEDMKALALVIALFSIQAAVADGDWEDIVTNHDGTLIAESSGPATENPIIRDTRNYGYNWWRYYSRGNGQTSNSPAERILDGLLRECNNDIVGVLSLLERRYNVRVNSNADLQSRLNAIVTAVNAQLSSSGYGYFRPIINAVAERIGTIIRSSTQTNTNGQWSGSASFSTDGDRVNNWYYNNIGTSQNWNSKPSDYNWGSQSGGTTWETQAQSPGNFQGSSTRPSQGAFEGYVQSSANFWPSAPTPGSNSGQNGSRPLFVPTDSFDDDWPPRRSVRE